MDVKAKLRTLSRAGVPATMPPAEAKYIILCNHLALILAPLILLYAPLELALGLGGDAAISAGFSLVMAGVLVLNAHGHWTAARRLLCAAALVAITVSALETGEAAGVQYFMFLIPPVTFLLFPPGERRVMAACAVITGLAFFGVLLAFPHVRPMLRLPPAALRLLFLTHVFGIFLAMIAIAHYGRSGTLAVEGELEAERDRSEALLLNILPAEIAQRLKDHPEGIADGFADVTVLFADIVGFTTLSAQLPPDRVVTMLNAIFTEFDDLAERLGLEKIKTIGDAYMVAGGLPVPRADHAQAVVHMGLGMIDVVRRYRERTGSPLQIRIGIHSGPVVAGVIGKVKFAYDLWGDTVNTASRMESHGVAGRIQVSEATQRALNGQFTVEPRGVVDVKGKGPMNTYLIADGAA